MLSSNARLEHVPYLPDPRAEEVCAPYYIWTRHGFKVVIASIKGGEVPMDEASLNQPFLTKEVSFGSRVTARRTAPSSKHEGPGVRSQGGLCSSVVRRHQPCRLSTHFRSCQRVASPPCCRSRTSFLTVSFCHFGVNCVNGLACLVPAPDFTLAYVTVRNSAPC